MFSIKIMISNRLLQLKISSKPINIWKVFLQKPKRKAKGVAMGDMQAKLLQKVEELTYVYDF